MTQKENNLQMQTSRLMPWKEQQPTMILSRISKTCATTKERIRGNNVLIASLFVKKELLLTNTSTVSISADTAKKSCVHQNVHSVKKHLKPKIILKRTFKNIFMKLKS